MTALSRQLEYQTDPLIALVAKVEDPSVKVRVLNSLAIAKLHAGQAVLAQEPLGQALNLIEELEAPKLRRHVLCVALRRRPLGLLGAPTRQIYPPASRSDSKNIYLDPRNLRHFPIVTRFQRIVHHEDRVFGTLLP